MIKAGSFNGRSSDDSSVSSANNSAKTPQRFARQHSQNNNRRASGIGIGNSSVLSISSRSNKTPTSKTPTSKSLNKSLNRLTLTPSRNAQLPKTPNGGGDRYIPNRSASLFDLGHFMMTSQNESIMSQSAANTSLSAPSSPHKVEYERQMRYNLNGGVTAAKSTDKLNAVGVDSSAPGSRILSYQKDSAPKPPLGHCNTNRVLYSSRPVAATSCHKSIRHIPATADRILDAPDIIDDYYLNLLDWSADNWLAVALATQVFLWNAGDGNIKQLLELESQTDYISAVKFSQSGAHLAVAVSTGEVQLWDVAREQRLRTFRNHTQRVASLAWNDYVLVSGSRDGQICQNDVRIRESLVQTLSSHTQEVCGLAFSPDGRFLASGANDNRLCIWQSAADQKYTESQPVHVFTDHQSAIKAIAWCPWQPSILASGGGTADRTIRFWNCNTGACITQVDTESQVVSLMWSAQYKELISAHGYPCCSLVIWKYPQMSKITELKGHDSRIISMAMSPCGEYVMSASADESLRLWHCFAVDASTKKKGAVRKEHKSGGMQARGGGSALLSRAIR